MKKMSTRILAVTLAAILVLCTPLAGVPGLTEWLNGLSLTVNAAHTWQAGDIGTLGHYPQMRVKDSATLSALNTLPLTWRSYGFYSGTGSNGTMVQSDYMKYADVTYNTNKYRAVKFTSYRPYSTTYSSSAVNSYQDDNGYLTNTVYWFKYQPLKWRVLDPSTGLAVCETIIDSQAYSNTIFGSSPYYSDAAGTIYANNYAASSVRAWLNNEFCNTAFTGAEQLRISATRLDDSGGTVDKIFLLSYGDAINTDYGFSPDTLSSPTRCVKGSDYAKCQGLYSPMSKYNLGNARWRLRSPSGSSSHAYNVYIEGGVGNYYSVNDTRIGIRPALKISDLSTFPESVPVTGVSLDKESLSLTYGRTVRLCAEVVGPSHASNQDVVWTSSDEAVATVDTTGLITGAMVGTAVITVTTDDGGFTDTCEVTVYAAHDCHTGDIGVFGSYPQTRVTDSATLAVLSALPLTWVGQSADVTYAGEKYRAVKFMTDTVNWFKYEPLRWRVLSPTLGLVMCEDIIDSQPYCKPIYQNNLIYYNDSAYTINANDYATSSLRAWLNNDFYNTVFTGTEQLEVAATHLDNDDIMVDKIFLLSYNDVINTDYGFNSRYTYEDTARAAQGSDYAKRQGNTDSIWWLRSPHIMQNNRSAHFIYSSGYGSRGLVDFREGVRPAIKISNLFLMFASSEAVSVTEISLDKEGLDLLIGEASLLTATIAPSDATNQSAIWTSSDETVARVGSSGIVTAVGPGTATITVTASDKANGTIIDTCEVTVSKIDAAGFVVSDIPDQTCTGGAITPEVFVTYGGNQLAPDTDYTVSYHNNIDVGTASVTMTGQGNYTGTRTVTFKIVASPVSSITLSSRTLALKYKETAKLIVTINPASATNKAVSWTSSNEKVATVDANGNVTAVGNGTATITAASEDGGKTASCTVTVKLDWWQWLINIMQYILNWVYLL